MGSYSPNTLFFAKMHFLREKIKKSFDKHIWDGYIRRVLSVRPLTGP